MPCYRGTAHPHRLAERTTHHKAGGVYETLRCNLKRARFDLARFFCAILAVYVQTSAFKEGRPAASSLGQPLLSFFVASYEA
jgi:hypothetical protein